ncbi:isopentenyl-diphosphate Delta-isomerase [Glutamicibacter sp. JC586]|uniref:isopentenyl-diphosphate Delta-isomerase n=1 Tax=Glutamicibacter sp. JC586 TaxID=2590552 RepID=UPI00135AF2A9|nr:isopentenyl-diphosphate Delta-isomerase [Glutamicibacter sp. JC586]
MDVILLSADGQPIGTQSKQTVHSTNTPLHQAFSCHVINDAGQVLATRRALGKLTWPGVWTNSFCGHPQPGEDLERALARHAQGELGLEVRDVRMALPDFRYRAVDASGIVENEICPVFTAIAAGEIAANPEEVMDYCWVEPGALAQSVRATPWAFSPWLVMQANGMELYRSRG